MRKKDVQVMRIPLLIFCLCISIILVVQVAPIFAQAGDSTVVLAVSGEITDQTGVPVEAWQVTVTNEERELTVSTVTDAEGKFALAFIGVNADDLIIAAVGETLVQTVQDSAGRLRGSVRHELTTEEIQAKKVSMDLRADPPPPGTPVLAVSGSILDQDGANVGQRWEVKVTNEGRNITVTGSTNAAGKYAVAFVGVDAEELTVAVVGETLVMTAQDSAGRIRGNARHELTSEEIQAKKVSMNLRAEPPPPGTPVLAVSGSILDQDGANVGERWRVEVTNEDRNITAADKTDAAGKYAVAFIDADSNQTMVADVGETVSVSVFDPDDQTLLGSESHQLTTADIGNAGVSINLSVTLPPPSTSVLAVHGQVTESGNPVGEGFSVRVQNQARQLTRVGVTDASGEYAVVAVGGVDSNSVKVAVVGETILVEVLDTGGQVIGSESHELTLEDVLAATVSIDVEIDPQLAVEPEQQQLTQLGKVKQTALLQNYPNPFNPETWLPYTLAEDADVTVRIYNLKGELIRTFAVGKQAAGVYLSREQAVYWDGTDSNGQPVASGVYFYQLVAGEVKQTRRMVVVK